jgi:NAD(P)H dehydrogenase (quinone)
MKHLIIYTHLNPQSFTKAVVDEVENVAKNKGHETQVIDLYADKFNPSLEFPDIQYSFMDGEAPEDIRKYQQQITWADHITFVYPLWWAQMPAMLKGFIDRVFTHGYAYQYDENGAHGLLNGKTVQLYINTGNASEVLSKLGIHDSIKNINEVGIFEFCGMVASTTFFGNVAMASDDDRKQYLESIKNIVV